MPGRVHQTNSHSEVGVPGVVPGELLFPDMAGKDRKLTRNDILREAKTRKCREGEGTQNTTAATAAAKGAKGKTTVAKKVGKTFRLDKFQLEAITGGGQGTCLVQFMAFSQAITNDIYDPFDRIPLAFKKCEQKIQRHTLFLRTF